MRWEELYLAKRYLAKPYPGVDDLLVHLQKEGYHMGLVTSRNKLELQSDQILEGWCDLGYFNSIIGSSDTERAKQQLSLAKAVSELQKDDIIPPFWSSTIYDYPLKDMLDQITGRLEGLRAL